MKIGFVCDQLGNLNRGGAEIQLDKTMLYLNRIEGIEVEIIDYHIKDISQYDIVHFFKSLYDYSSFSNFLSDKKVPYVVSPIFFPATNYNRSLNTFKLSTKLPNVIQEAFFFSKIFKLWNNAFYLFPNTEDEAFFIKKVGVASLIEVIPNGLDPEEMKDISSDIFFNKYPFLKEEKFVLNVARVDRRKNQKKLVEACQKLNVPVVIIGNIGDKEYFREIRELKYEKFFYLGAIYEKDILFSAYNACELFCLPSTMETPGIAALEAAYYNKPVVITKYGGTQSYFKDRAYYVDWRSVKEIMTGIEFYYNKPVVSIKPYIEEYTWDKIAQKYKLFYEKVLNK